jgi:hypothetical protein
MQSKEKAMTPEQTLDWLAEQHKSQCNEDRPVQEWIRSMKSMLPAPVQDLPFGVGGGLVAIKTLLGRDPCVHANTAIEMIDAILKEHPTAQRQCKWPTCQSEEYQQALAEQINQELVTGAAQRQWIGLTRAECLQIEKDMAKYYDYRHECKTVCLPEFARAIEAKLKEKNNG